MDIIDTASRARVDTLPTGQEGQALVYVAGAVPQGPGTENLGRQGLDQPVRNADASISPGPGHVQVTVRGVKGLDMVQLHGTGLTPNAAYTAYAAHGDDQVPLVSFSADAKGAVPQALAFVKFPGRLRHRPSPGPTQPGGSRPGGCKPGGSRRGGSGRGQVRATVLSNLSERGGCAVAPAPSGGASPCHSNPKGVLTSQPSPYPRSPNHRVNLLGVGAAITLALGACTTTAPPSPGDPVYGAVVAPVVPVVAHVVPVYVVIVTGGCDGLSAAHGLLLSRVEAGNGDRPTGVSGLGGRPGGHWPAGHCPRCGPGPRRKGRTRRNPAAGG